MATSNKLLAACRTISQHYSACDVSLLNNNLPPKKIPIQSQRTQVHPTPPPSPSTLTQKFKQQISDALLKLKIPQAGYLADITPLAVLPTNPNPNPNPNPNASSPPTTATRHIVAPISTILFASKTSPPPTNNYPSSNIPSNKHWTDLPAPGTIAVLQQPSGQVCAVCGDILATRLKVRGVRGLVAEGRVRDLIAMRELCSPGGGGGGGGGGEGEGEVGEGEAEFTVWSQGTSTVGTGLEAKAWAVDVPLMVGGVEVQAGDVLCADEGEQGCVVIPQGKLEEVMGMLAGLKAADDRCVADVKKGVDVNEAFRRHR
ncbi:hypothetical protein B0A50_00173 [Salinomyces thailandicus]|uniref:DlpA domain-containing protein n=1 Tax=Salinomyces thailandicus TaxID=706561 RepID=A0A4U0UF86_9PEZI|nr:hypothetical protein B0A50_00173 [Salinomyces thailandica]